MTKNKKTIIKTVIITLIAIMILGKIFGRGKKTGNITTVRLENPQIGELIELVSAPGQIEPKTNVEISAKVSARIVELPFKEGQQVTKGDPKANPPIPPSVLVRLDSKDLESQLRSTRASRESQAAQIEVERTRIASQKSALNGDYASLKQAERDVNRQKTLLESHDISQSLFDQKQAAFEELKSKYEAAQQSLKAAELNLIVLQYNLEAADAQIEQAEERLAYTTITSPIDGVLTRLNAEIGEVVMTGTMNNPGTIILEVADLSQMIVSAQVDEADIGKLKVGQKAIVNVQSFPDKKFTGIVDNIALTHSISSSTGSKFYETEILLDPSEQQLYSGLTADVDIETFIHRDVIKIPSQAILARKVDDLPLDIRNDNPYVNKDKTFATVVYRFIKDKSAVTPVKIGPSDLTHTIIPGGLSKDDQVVVGPYKVLESLKHDMKVQDEAKSEKKKEDEEDKK